MLVGAGECGAVDAVVLDSITLADKTKVAVSPPATLRCSMAEAVAVWLREDVAPAALKLGAPLRGLDNFDSYECRTRNRVPGATLSEHGRANAIDVRAFKLANGKAIGLTDVNVAKDTVTLGIVACDTCNKTDPPTYNKANVVFQFPKGSLANASAGGVEDVIGQVLSISSDDQGGQQQGADQGGQQQGGQQAGADQGQQQQAEQPAAEPASIEKGMTTDQVEAAMGKPEKKVTLGTKQIYYYKDMKVIFLSGKVSDVQ